jgi:hypothetical protein
MKKILLLLILVPFGLLLTQPTKGYSTEQKDSEKQELTQELDTTSQGSNNATLAEQSQNSDSHFWAWFTGITVATGVSLTAISAYFLKKFKQEYAKAKDNWGEKFKRNIGRGMENVGRGIQPDTESVLSAAISDIWMCLVCPLCFCCCGCCTRSATLASEVGSSIQQTGHDIKHKSLRRARAIALKKTCPWCFTSKKDKHEKKN